MISERRRYATVPEKDYFWIQVISTSSSIAYISIGLPSAVTSSMYSYIEYSSDKVTWTRTENTNSSVSINIDNLQPGVKYYFRGVGTSLGGSSTSHGTFRSYLSNCSVGGNIMSLLYGEDFVGKTTFPSGSTRTFQNLLSGQWCCSVEELVLPATTLVESCYAYMLSYNTISTSPQMVKNATLANRCYLGMFTNCSNLTIAPTLSSTTLAQDCYAYMFSDCTSLVNAPALPAKILQTLCYENMFKGCTSLIKAPTLSATTIASFCYSNMFEGCTSLTETQASLSATTLQSYCYKEMFKGCTSLTTAPILPATTLKSNCYEGIFNGCSSLNYIKAMFTTTPSDTYTKDWVNGVASSGTFVKKSSATWNVTGTNGIPNGWTVQTASS